MTDSTASSDIRIDKEGTWYFRGAEMFRREIVDYFYRNLKLDDSGRYVIELSGEPGERCYVDADDTAFVVRAVWRKASRDRGENIVVTLSDGTEEILNPLTLRIGRENVMYCTVKDGRFPARFSKAGYYQLAELIDYDVDRDAYYLTLNDQRYDIQNPTV